MGPSLASNLQKLGRNFTGLVRVEGLSEVDLVSMIDSIQAPPSEYDLNAVQYDCDAGTARLRLATNAKFEIPSISTSLAPPSGNDEAFVEGIISRVKRSSQPIPYYVGPSLHKSGECQFEFDTLLHPGFQLKEWEKRRGPMAGVTQIYWHWGKRGSGTAFHCEDGGLRSVNLNLVGWKLWMLVRLDHTQNFEDYVQEKWGSPTDCNDQWVRHHNLFLSPAELRKAGIEFDLVRAGPGDMVVTGARQYHLVVNMSEVSFAVAINILFPDDRWDDDEHSFKVCRACGFYQIANHGELSGLEVVGEEVAEENEDPGPGTSAHCLPTAWRWINI